MIEKAMADPRFAEIFGMLKGKADSGELDLSALGAALGGTSPADEAETEAKAEEASASSGMLPDLSALLKGGGKHDFAKHERLLSALRPYLSDGKKNAVDTVLKAAKVGDIIEAFGGMTAGVNPRPTNKN